MKTKTKIIDLGSGVFIESSENLIKEQENWDDEDSCKDFDFSESPFWIITDTGTEPISCKSVKEGRRICKKEGWI